MASQSYDYKALKNHMSKQNQNEMALKCVHVHSALPYLVCGTASRFWGNGCTSK